MAGLDFTKRGTPSVPRQGKIKLFADEYGEPQQIDDRGNVRSLRTRSLVDIDDAGDMAAQSSADVAITGGSASLTGALGYDGSIRGTVTQTSSKSTSVTLDALTGKITMAASTLNAGAAVSFTLNNSTILAEDQIEAVHYATGTIGAYMVIARATGDGAASITVSNLSAANLSQAIVIKYSVRRA